ncbi:MAG: NusG domain II-containing protein [Clostridia bacterium]|nr:NusG domain II-containing protein [Clostridia bacterium]
MFRFGDAIVYAVLCALCVLLFLLPFLQKQNAPLLAEIIVDGEVSETIDLSNDEMPVVRTVRGCEISFSREGVRVSAADCPDQLCVKTGTIRFPGESIACVPNRVVVVLRRQTGTRDPYDMVAY